MNFIDAYVDWKLSSETDLMKRLGIGGACFVGGKEVESEDVFKNYCVEVVTENPSRNLKLPDYVDLVYVESRDESTIRGASESWGVDAIVDMEDPQRRDPLNQRYSGADHKVFRFMAEKGIYYIIGLKRLLECQGMKRSQLIGKIRQNIFLAEKYGVKLILASHAKSRFQLKSPRDLMAVGLLLGMNEKTAKDAVTKNPVSLIAKADQRQDPNILTSGLKVTEWGSQKPGEKRMRGWY